MMDDRLGILVCPDANMKGVVRMMFLIEPHEGGCHKKLTCLLLTLIDDNKTG